MNARMPVLALSALLLAPAAARAAPQVGWVRAETWAERDVRPGVFWPGRLLDGRASTAFCVDGGPEGARGRTVAVGFKGRPRIDRVRIVTGRAGTSEAFAGANRVVRLRLRDAHYAREITLQDVRRAQVVALEPPIESDWVEMEIVEAVGTHARTCLSDVIFETGGRALSGAWMARHLAWHPDRASLQGVWAAGPEGAPEKFLALFTDGTFRFQYVPNDPDLTGHRLEGRWAVRQGRLMLQTGGRWYALGLRRSGPEPDELLGVTRRIDLGDGRGAVGRVGDTYRDRWL